MLNSLVEIRLLKDQRSCSQFESSNQTSLQLTDDLASDIQMNLWSLSWWFHSFASNTLLRRSEGVTHSLLIMFTHISPSRKQSSESLMQMENVFSCSHSKKWSKRKARFTSSLLTQPAYRSAANNRQPFYLPANLLLIVHGSAAPRSF